MGFLFVLPPTYMLVRGLLLLCNTLLLERAFAQWFNFPSFAQIDRLFNHWCSLKWNKSSDFQRMDKTEFRVLKVDRRECTHHNIHRFLREGKTLTETYFASLMDRLNNKSTENNHSWWKIKLFSTLIGALRNKSEFTFFIFFWNTW